MLQTLACMRLARLRHSPPVAGAGDITTVIMGCGQSTPGNDKKHLRVLLWLRHARGQLLSEPKSDQRFSKIRIFLVVALNEESNGDVNKNTENGGTKMMTDLNGSNNGKRMILSD